MKRFHFRLPKLALPTLTPAAANLLAFVAGLLLFAVGLSLWYLPAGLIGGGLVLMGVAVFGPGKEGAR